MRTFIHGACVLVVVAVSLVSQPADSKKKSSPQPNSIQDEYLKNLDDLSALWSFYKYAFMTKGQVIMRDQGQITTSEGQGYALLRSVWSGDRETFDQVWQWTKTHLQIRKDALFAWKWKDEQALDLNSATDADTDIALALILAARHFDDDRYLEEARKIVNDIWNHEVFHGLGSRFYLTAGNWASQESYVPIHPAYLAPYAYEVFEGIDSVHPWRRLIKGSYEILNWIFVTENLKLPPEIIYLDKATGRLSLRDGSHAGPSDFSYDSFPLYWRMALDITWFDRHEKKLYAHMLDFFSEEWTRHGRFVDHYTTDGSARSSVEALPLYATLTPLALLEKPEWGEQIQQTKFNPLFRSAVAAHRFPYYFENWCWFSKALQIQALPTYDEFLGFLRPFNLAKFWAHFPFWILISELLLYALALAWPAFRPAFLILGLVLCGRYIEWRLFHTLNHKELAGPVLSFCLWAAEFYCFATVCLLLVQTGFGRKKRRSAARPATEPRSLPFEPSVDIFIPIYSESLEILEKTLIGASAIDYKTKSIYVCDDGHRDETKDLAARYGAVYIKGPKKHAKAGNLNNAMKQTHGELLVVFDTDHIPATTFLRETVPFFEDPKLGFVQTPHHFYNEDIFQRAFVTHDDIPNEQDMFNHAIQSARNRWGGSFFVGSGAVFRRKAIESVGGFNLMSITEDIHTSQHLHAKGWTSAFVDKDLAVGLTAENLSSYLVQRRRWMQGCLQIFFKDNPLFCKGLSLRHRIGYFASLFYFFYPIPRVIFFLTPLMFLLFHLHPLFSDISVLLAYLIPYLVLLPLLSSVCVSGWPRLIWGSVYENAVCFQLFRSMFDLMLPTTLAFKVTPKGIISDRRAFDYGSVKISLIMGCVAAFAVVKGLAEFWYFGIEKDAYFFNLIWAGLNMIFLAAGLMVAWERPQRRSNDRISKSMSFTMRSASSGHTISGVTSEISLSGFSIVTDEPDLLPSDAVVELDGSSSLCLKARLIYRKQLNSKTFRAGFKFARLTTTDYKNLVLKIFCSPESWNNIHSRHTKSHIMVVWFFFRGLIRGFRGAHNEPS